jgi:serine phosphatase RsbU (regulator of sigma subunit)
LESDLPKNLARQLSTEPESFLRSLNREIRRIPKKEVLPWEHALSVMRRHVPADQSARQHQHDESDAVTPQHWRVFSKTAYVVFTEREYDRDFDRIGNALISTVELSKLLSILADRLPSLGIRQGYVALYEDPPPFEHPQLTPEWSRLCLAYTEAGRIELPASGVRFKTRELIPREFRPSRTRYTLVAEALYFEREQIGFVLLGDGARDDNSYMALRGKISNALHSALLVESVQQHAHELAAAYEEIRILNKQLKEENIRMSAELDVARQIQEMILPKPEELQVFPGLEIVGYMQPADEVGGDYYDVLGRDGILHIGIGDVTGHGLESGVLMLMTQTAIRTLIEHGETDPVRFVTTLNRTIYKNVRRMGAEKTLTFSLINYQDGHIKLVGQHEEILIVRHGGVIERVDTVNLGFPIGLEVEIAQWVATAQASLNPGESVVLYTDGITEAENLRSEQYGIERLCEVISRHWDCSAEAIKQAVVDDVFRHIGHQKVFDDVTIVVLKQH